MICPNKLKIKLFWSVPKLVSVEPIESEVIENCWYIGMY